MVPWTVIQKWYEQGKYVPYGETALFEELIRAKRAVHPWSALARGVSAIRFCH